MVVKFRECDNKWFHARFFRSCETWGDGLKVGDIVNHVANPDLDKTFEIVEIKNANDNGD